MPELKTLAIFWGWLYDILKWVCWYGLDGLPRAYRLLACLSSIIFWLSSRCRTSFILDSAWSLILYQWHKLCLNPSSAYSSSFIVDASVLSRRSVFGLISEIFKLYFPTQTACKPFGHIGMQHFTMYNSVLILFWKRVALLCVSSLDQTLRSNHHSLMWAAQECW